MSERTEFVQNLKIGDAVAIFEGYIDPDTLSKIVSITPKYIQVERYPSLKFDRQTGNQICKNGKRAYRYLFEPEELQIQKEHDAYKEKIVELIDSGTLTAERYEQCRATLEQILKD